jgi:hypothetical protein
MHMLTVHSVISGLAVSIAFLLPEAAGYILFQWWPQVTGSTQLLLISELALAAVLLLLFHAARIAWEGRRMLRISQIAGLIEVRGGGEALPLRNARTLLRNRSATRDALILAVTGYDTFVAANSNLGRVIGGCYEIRVLLLNPHGAGAAHRARSFGDPAAALQAHQSELDASIRYLKQLNTCGKKVCLKLYESPPFWKVVLVGEQAWIQYCHGGYEVKTQPEYVFGLRHDRPEQGLFPPFYMHFLDQWNDPRNSEYDLRTDELVFRDGMSNEVRRIAYPLAERTAA